MPSLVRYVLLCSHIPIEPERSWKRITFAFLPSFNNFKETMLCRMLIQSHTATIFSNSYCLQPSTFVVLYMSDRIKS